jgi:SAM-dependent methyltransferase
VTHAAGVRSYHTCRVCNNPPPLEPLFSLGLLAVSDFVDHAAATSHDRPAIPLALMRCPECTLVQLRETTPPAWLYSTYWYRSGINEVMRDELADVVRAARAWYPRPLRPSDHVLDIGANDGTLLAAYNAQLHRQHPARFAFEPATNLKPQLVKHAERVWTDRFPPPYLLQLKFKETFQIITSIAMFYAVDDPNAFVQAVAKMLAPEGVWVLQFQDLLGMLESGAVDNICHEHLEYYSLYSLQRTLEHNALVVQDVEHRAINGGSLRVFVQHRDRAEHQTEEERRRVLEQLAREDAAGLHGGHGVPAIFHDFVWRVTEVRKQLVAAVDQVRRQGGTVDLYGASTKANTLLQWCGLNRRLIRRAIDRTPAKWSRYTVGTHIPIVSEEEGRTDPATAWLVGIWQFRPAVLLREAAYLEQGGTLIFPLPQVEIVTAATEVRS